MRPPLGKGTRPGHRAGAGGGAGHPWEQGNHRSWPRGYVTFLLNSFSLCPSACPLLQLHHFIPRLCSSLSSLVIPVMQLPSLNVLPPEEGPAPSATAALPPACDTSAVPRGTDPFPARFEQHCRGPFPRSDFELLPAPAREPWQPAPQSSAATGALAGIAHWGWPG